MKFKQQWVKKTPLPPLKCFLTFEMQSYLLITVRSLCSTPSLSGRCPSDVLWHMTSPARGPTRQFHNTYWREHLQQWPLTPDGGRYPWLDTADSGWSLLPMIWISPVARRTSSQSIVVCLVSKGAVVWRSDSSWSGKAVEWLGNGALLNVTARSTGLPVLTGLGSILFTWTHQIPI